MHHKLRNQVSTRNWTCDTTSKQPSCKYLSRDHRYEYSRTNKYLQMCQRLRGSESAVVFVIFHYYYYYLYLNFKRWLFVYSLCVIRRRRDCCIPCNILPVHMIFHWSDTSCDFQTSTVTLLKESERWPWTEDSAVFADSGSYNKKILR